MTRYSSCSIKKLVGKHQIINLFFFLFKENKEDAKHIHHLCHKKTNKSIFLVV